MIISQQLLIRPVPSILVLTVPLLYPRPSRLVANCLDPVPAGPSRFIFRRITVRAANIACFDIA